MNLASQFVSHLVPPVVHQRMLSVIESRKLAALERVNCDAGNLRALSSLSLEGVFTSTETASIWNASRNEIGLADAVGDAGGVNAGELRAIHCLVSKLKPESVFEVVARNGSSTLHIASALFATRVKHGEPASLTSACAEDGHSSALRPGGRQSTAEIITKRNFGSFVRFVREPSSHFMANCEDTFDFIFLDGGRTASNVYQGVPAALRLLKPNGIILVHGYFPLQQPLWSNGRVVPGPYLAITRLVREGLPIVALPLGRLPWPTTAGSNYTSLALLTRKA